MRLILASISLLASRSFSRLMVLENQIYSKTLRLKFSSLLYDTKLLSFPSLEFICSAAYNGTK